MNIVQINSCNYGSTGKIMLQTAYLAIKENHKCVIACPDSRENRKKKIGIQIFVSNRFWRNVHLKLAFYLGLNGCFSYFDTKKFINKLKKMNPDVIHLHNLHNCYINLKLLFNFIKKHKIKTVWTLHDCWAFTGHCPHFLMADCYKWKTGCYNCPKYKEYPQSYVDNSKFMYKFKKKWFTGVDNLTIVTPSKWLGDLVKQSFLKDYPVKVINNGIDLSVFKPTESDFRKKYNLENKFILLGVAFGWGVKKGLDVFVELSKKLDDRFQIVLVGTNDEVDKQLPDNIISIHRTNNQQELAEIYTAADLFVNPTREENYPTVNMESLACGTPVITFNTGGSPEIIDETCGMVVPKDDAESLYNEIVKISTENPYYKEACLKRSEDFDMHKRFEEYVKLYEVIE